MKSMTGFGRGQAKGGGYDFEVEIKSMNHRFREMRFRLPPFLSSQEGEIRRLMEANLRRGSFQVTVNAFVCDGEALPFHLDAKKVKSALDFLKPLCQDSGVVLTASVGDFDKEEFSSCHEDDEKKGQREQSLKKAVLAAISELNSSRCQEGESLKSVLKGHLQTYQQLMDVVEKACQESQEKIRKKLLNKFAQFSKEEEILSTEHRKRFDLEIIYYLEKMDIAEEVNRLKVHVKNLDQLFSSNEERGKNMGFILQELLRETNTMASKALSVEISQAVIQMKLELEKMREQALNVE